jgi:hypothetical protein
MRAIAVFPGKPDSVHLADLLKPSLDENPGGRKSDGQRPVHGAAEKFDPHWRDLILFYEYFHGDPGAGVGASHPTGWAGLVVTLLQQSGDS